MKCPECQNNVQAMNSKMDLERYGKCYFCRT